MKYGHQWATMRVGKGSLEQIDRLSLKALIDSVQDDRIEKFDAYIENALFVWAGSI